ncbi:TetR/AcrR family transcriptional regulator; helix-turn-helix transcriptional regulator [Nocardioidaceae bacterium]|nr:TetR/AcrR family transcriptional regulator; helix-turn-helix transcriptional regulator [Nocardioidaceae bacterium]
MTSSAPEPSLRERRRVELRAHVAARALRLFADEGFDAVTAERLTTESGISRRTFFSHFASKEDVVAHGANDDLRDLAAGLEAHRDAGFVAALRASASHWVASVGEHAERRRLRVRIESSHPRVRAAVREARLDELHRVALPHVAADLDLPREHPLVGIATGGFAGLGLALDDVMLSPDVDVDVAGAVEQAITTVAGMLDGARAAAHLGSAGHAHGLAARPPSSSAT